MSLFPSFPKQKHQVLYIDPPWQYTNKKTGGSFKSGADSKYPTLSLEELVSLPINQVAEKDCVIFLWATNPLLPEAFWLLKKWGFKYKTMITWDKDRLGIGFWLRGQTEFLIFGVRGKIKAFRSDIPNIVRAKSRRHSEKPEKFRQIIDKLTPNLDGRIELFARKRIPNWNAWGNDERLQNEPLEVFA